MLLCWLLLMLKRATSLEFYYLMIYLGGHPTCNIVDITSNNNVVVAPAPLTAAISAVFSSFILYPQGYFMLSKALVSILKHLLED
jgi:hypothetical protein